MMPHDELYGTAAAYESGRQAGIAEERARVVAWLRERDRIECLDCLCNSSAADALERGDHIQEK